MPTSKAQSSKTSWQDSEIAKRIASDPFQAAYDYLMATQPCYGLAVFHHRNTNGELMDFTPRLWQVPIYQDNHPSIVLKKCSQVGATDAMIVKLFYHAREGRVVLYVLPTESDRNKFVPRRIDKQIAWSATKDPAKLYMLGYRQARKDSDMKSQKTLFGKDCMFVGSNSATAFYEKPCDVLIFDEFDKCNQANLVYAYDRIGASKEPFIYKLGNPTITGFGIDDAYDKSDQRVWMIQCGHCNERQPLDWFINVVEQAGPIEFRLRDESSPSSSGVIDGGKDISVLCRRCNKPINRLGPGEWVAKYTDRDDHGYHINRIFGDARASIGGRPVILAMYKEFLAAQNNPTALQRFWNNVLGEAYRASGSALTHDILAACTADYKMPVTSEGGVAGVDVGSQLDVQIEVKEGEKSRMVFAGTVPSFDELDRICRLYKIHRGVIDGMPEGHATRQFVKAHKGWYMCFYNLPETAKTPIEIDRVKKVIRTNRTASLDATFATYATGEQELPVDWQSLMRGEWVKQMTASTRVFNEDKQVYEWVEGAKADHQFHAANYRRMAADIAKGAGSFIRVL